MPFASYARLLAEHGKLLGFGFVVAFSSSFGQTYFIGIFGPEIQAEFGLGQYLPGGNAGKCRADAMDWKFD